MTIIKAIIIGLVAGITDFLPVSTTGHITLFGNIMGIQGDIDLMLIIALHLGTLISILLVYFRPVVRCFLEFIGIIADLITNIRVLFSGRSGEKVYRKIVTNSYRKLVVLVLIALIPTIVIGCFVVTLTESLACNILASGIGLMVTALLLLVASFTGRLYKGPHEAKVFDAVLIGAFQGFSGFTGISRLGMSTSSAYLSGFTTKLALLFSFILAIPTVIGAFAYEAIRNGSAVPAVGIGFTLIAMMTAAIVGYFALVFLRRFLSSRFTRYFAAYCFVIGIVSIVIYLV